MIHQIGSHRIAAALASGGGASDVIHANIIKTMLSIGAGGDVCDLGAGYGALTERLLQLNTLKSITSVDIVEYQERKELPGVRWLSADLNDKLSIPDASFDSIIASEVIEHLENPRAFVRECFRLLRHEGRLILSTPNCENIRSLISLMLKGHFWAFVDSCYPAHITPLLRADFQRIFSEAGICLVGFRYTDYGCLPGITRYTWQQVSAGGFRGVRFSDNLIVIGQKPNA